MSRSTNKLNRTHKNFLNFKFGVSGVPRVSGVPNKDTLNNSECPGCPECPACPKVFCRYSPDCHSCPFRNEFHQCPFSFSASCGLREVFDHKPAHVPAIRTRPTFRRSEAGPLPVIRSRPTFRRSEAGRLSGFKIR